MWHAQHTLETTTRPESIWRCWTNVQGWPEWDESLQSAALQGPVQIGTPGLLTWRRGGRIVFRVTEFVEGRRLACSGRVLGTELLFRYSLEPSELGTRLTHSVEARGLLAPILAMTLGHRLKENLPLAARKLARLAERA